jgi:superfamily II DNA/RNA helicase
MSELRHRRRNAGPRRSGVRPPAARRAASEIERQLTAALAEPAPEPRTFTDFGLPSPIVDALRTRGITGPMPIQARTLPDALAGRDVLGRAQTGSGKTLGFGLPMLARLAGGSGRTPAAPRGLVLAPTRELANQIAEVIAPLGETVGVRVSTVYGGAPIGRQIELLRRGVDVVVATPGRLIDLLERNACSLSQVEITVLDEADHMADLGFLPAVTRLLDATPARGQRMLFSATLDRGVDKLVRTYLNRPTLHAVADTSVAEAMQHRVLAVSDGQKVPVAAEITARPGRTLVFVRTKHGADRLARQLSRAGSKAAAIHGNLNQNQRQRALDGFAAGSPRVLVATDVAARGIHVDDVDMVVHFDPPNDHKDYLHRSGRTARAGATGTVLVLAEKGQLPEVARLHRDASIVATTTPVHIGHPAVRELAESGTPIVVAAPTQRARPAGSVSISQDGRRSRPAGTRAGRPAARSHRRAAGSTTRRSAAALRSR